MDGQRPSRWLPPGAMTTFRTSPTHEDLPSRELLVRASNRIGVCEPGQAWHWLKRLAQKTPLEMIETDSGFHSVLDVLGRIEHRV